MQLFRATRIDVGMTDTPDGVRFVVRRTTNGLFACNWPGIEVESFEGWEHLHAGV
jgi:hypothetical protein